MKPRGQSPASAPDAQTPASMLQHDWLNAAQPPADHQRHAPRYHRQLEETNTTGLIRTAAGLQMLMHLVSDYLDLLGTAAAVFEKDSTYALRLCASGWCRTLDAASRRVARVGSITVSAVTLAAAVVPRVRAFL